MSPRATFRDVLKRALLGALLALLVVLGAAQRPVLAPSEGAVTNYDRAASTYDAHLNFSTGRADLQGQGARLERIRENGSREGSVPVSDSAYAVDGGMAGVRATGRAVAALRKLKVPAARAGLERMLDDDRAWGRKEAQRALAALD